MSKSTIAILTTVANFELYGMTSRLFPKDIKKYVIDGRNGMHGIHSIYYMFKKLSNKDIDWLILADEDVIFKDSHVVFSIIAKMKGEQISVCGVRDGGVIAHRHFNPLMVNTFFTIINFKEILKIWNKNELKKQQFILPSEFNLDSNRLNSTFDLNSLYEPYYCFFLWLKRKGKNFLYLDAQMLDDGISNSIIFNNKEFAYHTWYARSYNANDKHTKRINNVLNNMGIDIAPSKINADIVIFKDSLFNLKITLMKFYKRFVNKFDAKNRTI